MKNGMKRWLGVLLAAALCLTMLPGALAAGEAFTVTPAGGAATNYATLAEALAAASDGCTVGLNANAAAAGTAALPAGATLALGAYTLTVPEGASLDLSAGTVTAAGGKLLIAGSVAYSADAAKRLSGTAVQLQGSGAYGGIRIPSDGEFAGKTVYAAPDMKKSMSLNLNDLIVINCYLEDPENAFAASAFALVDGKKTAMTRESANWYLPVRESAAKEMTRENVVQLVGVDAAGAYHVGAPNALSIRGYAEELLAGIDWENEKNAKLGRTMIAMLNYGAQAQKNFSYEQDDLANKNLTPEDQTRLVYNATTVADHRVDARTLSDPEGLYYSSACVLGSSLALRFYLNLPASRADREALSFRIGYQNYRGNAVAVTKTFADLTPTNMSGVYYLETTGVAAADVKSPVTLSVSNDSGEIASVTDSVVSYCARVHEAQQDAHDLADQLLSYGLSAFAYFYQNHPNPGDNELPIA